ncbi:MAG TPA: head GIN domain-containing protein [Chitinophagaceae bacterium]
MRRILMLAILASVFTSSYSQKDNDKKKIEGSGNVVTKNITVQSFDQLDVSGVFSVQLTQGSKEELKIEADDNLQEYFEVKNEGSKLSVGMKKDVNYSTKSKMKVYITFKKLSDLDLKTVGNVSSSGNLNFDKLDIDNKSVGNVDLDITAQSVKIDNKSVGNVKLSGKADNVIIKNKSVGSIEAANFAVQTMDIDNNGVGSAEVNAAKELKVKDSFLGKVSNKGAATPKRSVKTVI